MSKGVMILLMIVVASTAYAQRKNQYVNTANGLYKEKKYSEAIPQYLKGVEANASDPVVTYNLGNAYFRDSKFEDASKTFDNTIAKGPDIAMKQKGYYNKGVSLSKQNKLEESIEAYKMAVKMDPKDVDARVNLQKALMELKKRMPPPPEKKEEKKKQQNNNQQKQPPKSNLTKKQVEQLLKALNQREQQVQQKMQQRNRTAGQQEKDW